MRGRLAANAIARWLARIESIARQAAQPLVIAEQLARLMPGAVQDQQRRWPLMSCELGQGARAASRIEQSGASGKPLGRRRSGARARGHDLDVTSSQTELGDAGRAERVPRFTSMLQDQDWGLVFDARDARTQTGDLRLVAAITMPAVKFYGQARQG